MRTPARHTLAAPLASLVVLSIWGCVQTEPVIAPRPMVHITPTALGQFVRCAGQECLLPTPKTLASRPPRSEVQTKAVKFDAPAQRPVPLPPARDALRLERAVVVFPFEGSAVGPQVAERLRDLLPLMRLAKRIQVRGYTDDQGPQAANDKVAQARALAVMVQVRQLLGDEAPQILSAKGQGLCCYISHNQTEAGRALNRRVEVLLSVPDTAHTQAWLDAHPQLMALAPAAMLRRQP
ncbi:MAG: hypothetical protein C4K60_20310 [Ideonella sp. MAG2]|nr:MAG: hypothetical protein C4K60_20310 [Ideonella sp. MAG2]